MFMTGVLCTVCGAQVYLSMHMYLKHIESLMQLSCVEHTHTQLPKYGKQTQYLPSGILFLTNNNVLLHVVSF